MKKTRNKVLLHCCCAPCTLLPLESLTGEGWELSLYYYNPNIHPKEEYELRLKTLNEYLKESQIPLHVGAYDPELWEERVGIHGGPYPLIEGDSTYESMLEARKKRCETCYKLRFEALAKQALDMEYELLDATLTISPYQFTQSVKSQLENAAKEKGLEALATDWRDFYKLATQRSRDLGMYRQNYCGCRYSKEEAQIEKMARKARKKQALHED